METEKYFITAIVSGSIFAGLFFFLLNTNYQSVSSEALESLAVLFLCLAVGFGLGGLVKTIMKRKRA